MKFTMLLGTLSLIVSFEVKHPICLYNNNYITITI